VDILGHVPIQHEKAIDVGFAPAPPWDFVVLDASQFVVLSPQIGFEDFDCGREPENVHVSLGEIATSFFIAISFFGEGR
jgi:hypothetical protein